MSSAAACCSSRPCQQRIHVLTRASHDSQHYAEADNELHHLLIMESLGGNSSVVDRTLAQTMAFGYYWYVTAVYSVSEPAAYHLSELIEDHAYNT